MACFHPLTAWQLEGGEVVFAERGKVARELELPCGQCVGCRLERSRQWAIRCIHEASLHEANSFVTLTYDDVHMPSDGSLVYSHFQKFMRRLRKTGRKARFYMCGEYGETTWRPHFHACLFGVEFPDRKRFSGQGELTLYTSDDLSRLWPHGHSLIGDVTFESAAYVARYVMKKITGSQADEHYTRVVPSTGEVVRLEPEFTRMSLKPGIGFDWIRLYHVEVLANNGVVVRGSVRRGLPRLYREYLKETDAFQALTVENYHDTVARAADNTRARLAVREQVTLAQVNRFARDVEL